LWGRNHRRALANLSSPSVNPHPASRCPKEGDAQARLQLVGLLRELYHHLTEYKLTESLMVSLSIQWPYRRALGLCQQAVTTCMHYQESFCCVLAQPRSGGGSQSTACRKFSCRKLLPSPIESRAGFPSSQPQAQRPLRQQLRTRNAIDRDVGDRNADDLRS
jgi:hypothetical protein